MKYKCGYKYITGELVQEKVEMGVWYHETIEGFVSLFGNGILKIGESYAWDGASFILFTWFGTPSKWLRPSLVHDALYQMMRESKVPSTYRKTVDGIFYRLLRENGVGWVEAKCAYWAVRLGGNYFMRHGPRMHEAP